MQEELIELQHDGSARDGYSESYLSDFWFAMYNSHKSNVKLAIQAVVSINMVM